jgi:hypothetical protein
MNFIKQVNILTYQSISQTLRENNDIDKLVFALWKKKEKFEDEKFENYIQFVRENNPKEFVEKYNYYKKQLKINKKSLDLLTDKVKNYLKNLLKV